MYSLHVDIKYGSEAGYYENPNFHLVINSLVTHLTDLFTVCIVYVEPEILK
jgi:hypothetical protein